MTRRTMPLREGCAVVLALIALCVAGARPALAAPPADLPEGPGGEPHARTGFYIGFGVGAGNAGIKNGADRETGADGMFRLGWAVRHDLVIGYEGSAWTRTENQFGIDVTSTFSVSVLAVTYYPNNHGIFLKAGIGFARATLEAAQGSLKVSNDDDGLGLLGALGFEWRLTRKFAMGPEVQFAYLDVGGLVDAANYIDGLLTFNWYW